MSQNVLALNTKGFIELNSNDVMEIVGGGFWDGLALVGGSIALGATVVGIVATTPISAPIAGAVVAGSMIASQFGFGVGLAMMCGADL